MIVRKRILTATFALLCALVFVTPAAAAPAPGWLVSSVTEPTDFSSSDPPKGNGQDNSSGALDRYLLTATNVGAAPTDGSPVTIADTLPPGLTAQGVQLLLDESATDEQSAHTVGSSETGGCTTSPVRCSFGSPVPPGAKLIMVVHVAVDPAASGEATNLAEVSGGGAPSVSTSLANRLNEGDAPFGLAELTDNLAGEDGQPDLWAGAHPRSLTTSFAFDTKVFPDPEGQFGSATPSEDPKHVFVDLPLGLAGDPLATPRCPLSGLTHVSGEISSTHQINNFCPAASQLGQLSVGIGERVGVEDRLMNMTPEPGNPAELGATVIVVPTLVRADVVPTPAGYMLRTESTLPQATQVGPIDRVAVTVYGNPAPLYNPGGPEIPFLTNPADCSLSGTTTTVHFDSWQNPGSFNADGTPNLSDPNWHTQSVTLPPVTGCNQLEFNPTIEAHPTTNVADSPSGLDVTLKVPQNQDPGGLATPPLKKAVIALPQGIAVNPSAANGLEGCTLAQLGMSAGGVPDAAHPQCPGPSKIGSVKLKTPLLEKELEGALYLAKPFQNPFGSLLALYLVVDDPETGVVLKLPGKVTSDPNTGQLTTVFDDNPQLPFEELHVHLFAGAKAALRTPPTCGGFETTSTLTPYSAPESGPPATPGDSFQIAAGPGGSSCPQTEAEEPNAPGFEAGTESPTAGAFSPFVLHLSRPDGSQNLAGLNLTLPPGLSGRLAGIPYCPDSALAAAREKSGAAEQAAPSCPPASRLGAVTVAAGAGPSPYYVQGSAYLSGPYKGAPLSVAILTPALAGPYDLGTVVVRAALEVNPETAQIAVKSDPIPTILEGIPLDLRSVSVEMDRSQFTLNPTSCDPLAVTGQALSVLNQAASLSDRFQVGGCRALKFKPKLKLSLKGSTRRAGHPALKAVLTMPPGGANIARAQVTIPKSEFLDNAHIRNVCTRVVFAEGAVPGEKCPAASIYGFARAITPLLDAPLEGPVYLRSSPHKLPDLVAALNGQIDVVLDGKIDTGKGGGIRNTFEVVPDAPVTKFTLSLKGGSKGLLVNSENLCSPRAKTHAIAHFTAQSGKVSDTEPTVKNSCKSGKHKKGHKGHKGHRHHHRGARR